MMHHDVMFNAMRRGLEPGHTAVCPYMVFYNRCTMYPNRKARG